MVWAAVVICLTRQLQQYGTVVDINQKWLLRSLIHRLKVWVHRLSNQTKKLACCPCMSSQLFHSWLLMLLEQTYYNPLFFIVKIFCTQKTYAKFLSEHNFTIKIFPMLVGSLLHTSTSPIAADYVYLVASNTTTHLLFPSHLFGTWCYLFNQSPPHKTCKIIFVQFGLCKNYFMRMFY